MGQANIAFQQVNGSRPRAHNATGKHGTATTSRAPANPAKAFLDVITSKRICSIVLYVVVGAWIVFRFGLSTMFSSYLLGLPFNLQNMLWIAVVAATVYSELCRLWRREFGMLDIVAIVVLALMGFGLFMRNVVPFLCDIMAVFAMRHEGFRRLSWFCVGLIGACVLIVFCSCALGAIPDIVIQEGGRIRHFLGFRYCLFPAQYLFTITCTLCWLLDRKMPWLVILALLAANVALFVLTDSRLSFLLGMAVLGVAAFRKVAPSIRVWKWLAWLGCASFLLVAVASVAAVYIYPLCIGDPNATWIVELDKMLGGRLHLMYNAVEAYGIDPMGASVKWIGNGLDGQGNVVPAGTQYNYVDNLIIHAAIDRGLIYAICLVALYTLVAVKNTRSGDYMLAIVIGALALHVLIDDLALLLHFNTLMFAIGSYLVAGAGPAGRDNAGALGRHGKPKDML